MSEFGVWATSYFILGWVLNIRGGDYRDMYVWMNGWMDGCMDGCTDEWMYGVMDLWM